MSSVTSFSRIGGTTAEFERSSFAKVLEFDQKIERAEGDSFLGKGDVIVALFKGSDGKITKQRLKWLNNKYPDGETVTLIFLAFCMEAIGISEDDPERNVLIDRMEKAMEGNGTFELKGYKVLMGKLIGGSTDGHLHIEVSR